MIDDYEPDLDIDKLPIPRKWPTYLKTAILNVLVLVRIAMISGREFLHNSGNADAARIQQLEAEVAMLRDENWIIKQRMARIPAHKRPNFLPVERMAILELQARRGWNLKQTGEAFQLSARTISNWHRRIEDDDFLKTRVPVNRFPDLVRYIVQQYKLFAHWLGKKKIADMICRAGIHIAVSTVGRILKEEPVPEPQQEEQQERLLKINAKYPGHTVHADLTTVPIGGYWVPWCPNAMPQYWPHGWWVLNVVDHLSRKCLGSVAFARRPCAEDVTKAMNGMFIDSRVTPKHLITDQGEIFTGDHYRQWCKANSIKPRYGAVGEHGSIARCERFHRNLKYTLRQTLISEVLDEFQEQLIDIVDWYNTARPHESLDGCTPDEIFYSQPKANELPRIEPRAEYPRGSPCASPQVDIAGEPGDALTVEIEAFRGRRCLPVIRVRRAA